MTKKHEELVEEVRLIWCEECADGPERYGYQRDVDMPACEGECEDLCRERAGKCIALILSAVRDGLELPDEAGRQWHLSDNNMDATTGMWLRSMGPDDILLIALTGTGKEKELLKEITKGQRP